MKAADPGLTFDWPQRERFPFVLFGCVFLSLLAHAGTFFVFQVVYPQRVTIPPPPPQVALLTPGSPENDDLLRWIAAEDPALVASARSVVPPGLLKLPYRPSFSSSRTPPLGSVEPPARLEFPPARDALAMIALAAPAPASDAGRALPMRTTLQLSGALTDRGVKPPTFAWKQRASAPLRALRALIGVTDRGEVRFAFIQQSSGDRSIDHEAARQLQSLAFAPTAEPLTWGMATVEFGAEAYLDAPAELRTRPPAP